VLLYTSPPEGLAWLPASAGDWARHYTVTRAAAERREDDTGEDDSTTT
jgi:hypothetical protein